jgi:Fic family protein
MQNAGPASLTLLPAEGHYSNLIEGHDTRPIDIERALNSDFAAEPTRRDLQLEAAAHIAVQAAIDTGAIDASQVLSVLATEIHRQFYGRLPDSLRW